MMSKQYIDALLRDSRIVELRHQSGDSWTTLGWFDDTDELLWHASQYSHIGNLFTSLQVPNIGFARRKDGKPIVNNDVIRFSRLLFDFDPVRPTSTASTVKELARTHTAREGMLRVMRLVRWPAPAVALSGNGYHLQYRVALPNDDATREMLRVMYLGMKTDFSAEGVDFDTTVRNPGRICTLYGTMKRKGNNAADRPHRESFIRIPKQWEQVRLVDLERVANFYAKQIRTAQIHRLPATLGAPLGKGDYRTLDVAALFISHGLYLQQVPDSPGKHWVKCPWQGEHSRTGPKDSVIWESTGGWPTYHCSHNHCDGRGIREVLALWGDADRFCSTEWRDAR